MTPSGSWSMICRLGSDEILVLIGVGQDPRPPIRDGDRMLEMSGETPVSGYDRPTVREDLRLARPRYDHRLDGDHQTRSKPDTLMRGPIIGHDRVLMKVPADPVADVFSNDPEAILVFLSLIHI